MAYHQIILKGAEHTIQYEAKAGEASIYPGMFLKLQSDGDFELQDEGETVGPKLIAVEDTLQGKTISDAYTNAYQMLARYLPGGQEVYAYLALNQTAVIGSALAHSYVSNGCLEVITTSSANLGAAVVGWAMEAVTTTSAIARIRVLIP